MLICVEGATLTEALFLPSTYCTTYSWRQNVSPGRDTALLYWTLLLWCTIEYLKICSVFAHFTEGSKPPTRNDWILSPRHWHVHKCSTWRSLSSTFGWCNLMQTMWAMCQYKNPWKKSHFIFALFNEQYYIKEDLCTPMASSHIIINWAKCLLFFAMN